MIYDDEFLRTLTDDPVAGVEQVCERAFRVLQPASGWSQREYDALLEAYILIQELDGAGAFPFAMEIPRFDLSDDLPNKCSNIQTLLVSISELCKADAEKVKTSRLRTRFRASIGKAFAYEFSGGDFTRVQTLVNQLRELITATNKLEGNHQRRLVKRLEAL